MLKSKLRSQDGGKFRRNSSIGEARCGRKQIRVQKFREEETQVILLHICEHHCCWLLRNKKRPIRRTLNQSPEQRLQPTLMCIMNVIQGLALRRKHLTIEPAQVLPAVFSVKQERTSSTKIKYRKKKKNNIFKAKIPKKNDTFLVFERIIDKSID